MPEVKEESHPSEKEGSNKGLKRRDALKLGFLAAAGVVAKPALTWLTSFGFIPKEIPKLAENLFEKVQVLGANKIKLESTTYDIGINLESLLQIFFEVARIEGGARKVDAARDWLSTNGFIFFISPIINEGASPYIYPYINLDIFRAEQRWFVEYIEKRFSHAGKDTLQEPEILKNPESSSFIRGAAFFAPENTTNGKAAILIDAGVVYNIFFRKQAQNDPSFREKFKVPLARLFDRRDIFLPHEFWHFMRYLGNPQRELDLVRNSGSLHFEDEERSAEIIKGLIAAGLGLGFLAREKEGPPFARILKAIAAGYLSKNVLDAIYETPVGTSHGHESLNWVEDAFGKDPDLGKIVLSVFEFSPMK